MHGQQGEVMGPARDKRVAVLFPGGNNGNINCLLTQVRRLCAASAAHSACAPPMHPRTRRRPRYAHAPSYFIALQRQPLSPPPQRPSHHFKRSCALLPKHH